MLEKLIISSGTMVLKTLILIFDKINMIELEFCVEGIDAMFKLVNSPSLMTLLFPNNFSF